jgi:hypothetical protein
MSKGAFIGGIKSGFNYPNDKNFLHIDDWKDVIIVDRNFFLQYMTEIEKWTKS